MPTPRHGKGAALVSDQYVLSAITKDLTHAASVDSADVTVHGSAWKSHLAGHRDFKVSAIGVVDSRSNSTSLDIDGIEDYLGSTDEQVVTFMPEGPVVGRQAKALTGRWVKHDITAPAKDAVGFAAEYQAGTTATVQLHKDLNGIVIDVRLSASTGASSSVDNTALSTGGYAINTHVKYAGAGTATFKVQHSSNGSAWSDLSTAAFTASGGLRRTGTGTVKRYTRTSYARSSTGMVLSYALVALVRR